MTFRDISPAAEATGNSSARLTALKAAIMICAITLGGHAVAGVACGTRAASHVTPAQCRPHPSRAAVQGARVQGARTRDAGSRRIAQTIDSGEVTPVRPLAGAPTNPYPNVLGGVRVSPTPARGASTADLAVSPASVLHQLDRAAAAGPSPWRGYGAPTGDRWPTSEGRPTAGGVTGVAGNPDRDVHLSDLMRPTAGSLPAVPALGAWAVLLAGLAGLFALGRRPAAEKVRSWAMAAPTAADRSADRARARGWAIDRVDPERYAVAQVRRPRQGAFVRAGARGRFGADG